MPTLLEIELPDGDVPALEGERLDDHAAREWHASPPGPSSLASSHSHSRFQNTLATSVGQVFCWGKGERGQLGQGRRTAREEREGREVSDRDNWGGGDDNASESGGEEAAPTKNRTFEYALHVPNFHDPHATASTSPSDVYAPLLSEIDSKVKSVLAGMNFTMAVTRSNLPYIWGKNVRLNPSYSASGFNLLSKPVSDSTYPRYIPGLPEGLSIERIACGRRVDMGGGR